MLIKRSSRSTTSHRHNTQLLRAAVMGFTLPFETGPAKLLGCGQPELVKERTIPLSGGIK